MAAARRTSKRAPKAMENTNKELLYHTIVFGSDINLCANVGI